MSLCRFYFVNTHKKKEFRLTAATLSPLKNTLPLPAELEKKK